MKDKRSFRALLQKYLPHWPLFALLVVASSVGAWAYSRMLVPMYEASATLLIKDASQSGVVQGMAGFNPLAANMAIENEIEVIRSRELMKEVVSVLHLYAPVFDEGDVKTLSAYTSSPVVVKAKDPFSIKGTNKIYFSFHKQRKEVVIDGKAYPLDHWVQMPYGEVMFSKNAKLEYATFNPTYFQLVPVKVMANILRGGVGVIPISRNSSVIMLKYRDVEPRRAEDIINELSMAYAKASIKEKGATTANTLAFVEDRIRFVEKELDSLENLIRNYKSQKGIVDLGSQGKMFLENLSSNDQQFATITNQITILNQLERYVQSKTGTSGIVPSTLGVNDPMMNSLVNKLYEAEMRYDQMRKTVPEHNPLVVALKNEIEKLKPSLLDNIRNQKAGLSASLGSINSVNRSYSSMLRTIPKKEKDLLDYTRQQAIKNTVYTFLLQKREEIALANSSTVPDSRVLEKAEASMVPNGPGKPVIYMMAVVLGLLVGAGFIMLKEMFSTTFLSREELEESTSAPVVAELAFVKGKAPIFIDRQNQVILFEQFRQLRVVLGLFGKVRNKKKVLVTSSISGEGKSFISSNLALSLAMAGKKVLLLDLDLRNPITSSIFGMKDERGVADYLEGNLEPFELVKQSSFENLYIIPAGNGDMINTVELLLNGKFQVLLANLQEHFDGIIIDTSPIEYVSDGYVLSEYCDNTIFVVRQGHTPKSMLQMANEHRKIKRLKNVSIVFNGVKPKGFLKKEYGYGYGYGFEKAKKAGKGSVTIS